MTATWPQMASLKRLAVEWTGDTVYYLELAGEDDRLAIAEAGLACTNLELVSPGVARASLIDRNLAERLAQTHTILDGVARTTGDLEALATAVQRAMIDRTGSVAVRATAVRGEAPIDEPAVERRIGSVLVGRGLSVDLDTPDHVLRILATGGTEIEWIAGWIVVKPPRNYGIRRPPQRPFKQPGTMRPQLARTLVNLSGVQTGEVLLDPMCGAGAILTEAALVGAQPVGVDLQTKMVTGARSNVAAFAGDKPAPLLVRGSAAELPIRRADAAVFDAPYGRQSPIGFDSAPKLVRATLAELYQLVETCVAVFDRPVDEQAAAVGWEITERLDRRVHRSLTRHIAVLRRRD